MQHCFVIDDSDVIRKYSRLIFESLGYRVSEAADATSALERIALESPDIILVDWHVPGADMLDVIEKIRAVQFDSRPYILYVTTEGDYGDVHRALKCGADDFLLKPFNREIIEMKLHEISVAGWGSLISLNPLAHLAAG